MSEEPLDVGPDDLLAAIKALADAPPRLPERIVHPDTFVHRLTCPMWTNRDNPEHVHDVRCSVCGDVGRNRTCHPDTDATSRSNLSTETPTDE